jgi:hypothetical protein
MLIWTPSIWSAPGSFFMHHKTLSSWSDNKTWFLQTAEDFEVHRRNKDLVCVWKMNFSRINDQKESEEIMAAEILLFDKWVDVTTTSVVRWCWDTPWKMK